MHACRYSFTKMLNAILSSLYVLCGHLLSLVMMYVAVGYTLVDAEAVVGATEKPDWNSVAVDCLETV